MGLLPDMLLLAASYCFVEGAYELHVLLYVFMVQSIVQPYLFLSCLRSTTTMYFVIQSLSPPPPPPQKKNSERRRGNN